MATELAKAYVQIIPSAKGIKGSIGEALNGEASSAGKSAGTSIASKIKGAIAAAGIGLAIGKAISSSLKEGAALQQSLGGIETLFQDSADKVIANAKNAYKTAGMSANQYMESVTSFSASLLQGLAGDTNKAADVADMALTDMSDNANKMGTSMELIQNAYQGFAKQNYTMLDNLKLGYGGTKTEMERLLADAEKLTGVEYDISNLSDVYEAIHAIQEDMGITGTTALEASKTFSGSLASMQAAAKDLLGNIALGEDIYPSLFALGDTVKTFVIDNLIPMFGNIASGIGEMLYTNGPQLITAGASMINSLVNGISGKLPEIMPLAFDMIVKFADSIIAALPTLFTSGINLLKTLVQGIITSLPTIIVEGPRIINEFANAIYTGLWQLLMTGAQMIVSLVQGLWENRGLILENAGQIILAIMNVFSLANLFGIGKNLILKLKEGVQSVGPLIKSAGKQLLQNLVNGIKALANHPITTLKSIATKAFNAIKNIKWVSIGRDIINGIISGVKATAGKLIKAAANAVTDALNWVKRKLGIHSPSTVFRDEVGKMINMGLAEGITKNTKVVSDSMKDLSMATIGGVDADLNMALSSPRTSGYGAYDMYMLGDYIVQAVISQGKVQAEALEKGIRQIRMIPDKRESARFIAEMGFARG